MFKSVTKTLKILFRWAVLLMALALVMLMGAFIKICSLHTKSDNPNMVPHRDFPGIFLGSIVIKKTLNGFMVNRLSNKTLSSQETYRHGAKNTGIRINLTVSVLTVTYLGRIRYINLTKRNISA